MRMPSNPVLTPWPVDKVTAAIGRSPGALNSLRKRGLFPAPDGGEERSPWWHADTVQSWLEARQRPPGAVSSRQAIGRELGLTPAKLDEHPLPPADGTHCGNSWWLPQTLHAWAGEVFAGELLDVDDIRDQLECSDDEWD